MKKLLLTITTLFLGLFTIASCDTKPKVNPDKVKEPETTQGNEKKEDNTDKKKEDKVEDKDKEKEKENKEPTTEDKTTNEKEPTTNDNGSTNPEQPTTDGTTSNGEQPSTSDNKQEEPTTDGTTSNEVGTNETGTNEKEPSSTEENGSSTNENGTSDSTPSAEPSTSDERTNGEEHSTNDSGITSDGRRTPEETARIIAFSDKRYEIKKRLREDWELNNSPEGIELARQIAPNWDMRYKTDIYGRPVDEFYLEVGSVEREKLRATSALNYGWQKISEERG